MLNVSKNKFILINTFFFFTILLFFIKLDINANQDSQIVTFNIEKIKKRNPPGCKRLGNVYGYCEWIVFLNITNNSQKPINYFCSNLKIINKKYEVCFGKNNKENIVKPNNNKIFVLNLNNLISYSNDQERPYVKLVSHRLKFSN